MIIWFYQKYHYAEDAAQQSEQIISNLQWILNYLRTEQNLNNRTVQEQNDREDPKNSYNYFFNKSSMCLELSDNFRTLVENNDIKQLLQHSRAIYINLKDKLSNLTAKWSSFATWEDIIGDDNFVYVIKGYCPGRNLLTYVDGDQRIDFGYDFEELHKFYRWLNEIDRRNELIEMIEAINIQIKDTLRTIQLTLYQVLNDYYNELKQYLHDNKDYLKTQSRRKYNFLKRSKSQIRKEKKRSQNTIFHT